MIKFKQFLVPAVIILMGAGAAFATNVVKNSQSTETGYYIDSSTGECKASPEDCTEEQGVLCTWEESPGVTHNLYRNRIGETSCVFPLYRAIN